MEPENHRVNADKRAIQTFENHFISGLCPINPKPPLQLWCYLLAHAEMTLNMIRTSRVDPTKSAYEVLEGVYDYNATPLSPPGCKLLIFKPSPQRAAWGSHAVSEWWVGPEMHHYRYGQNWIESTLAIQISRTAKVLPAHCSLPAIFVIGLKSVKSRGIGYKGKWCNYNGMCRKMQHIKILKQLNEIIKNKAPPTVANT